MVFGAWWICYYYGLLGWVIVVLVVGVFCFGGFGLFLDALIVLILGLGFTFDLVWLDT